MRNAVRACIEPTPIVVGCSGGPDSLALTAAAAWVADHLGIVITAAIIDHGLQAESADVAQQAAEACRMLGVADVVVQRVHVGTHGGMEAAARDARRAALQVIAVQRGSEQILLAHTREDQAETVLLRLARGAGARSLAAMRTCATPWHRPLLDTSRTNVHAVATEVCAPLGITPWRDPHNLDRAFARVRVRSLLDELVADLGPGIVHGLTRSASLLGDDADLLDRWADAEYARVVEVSGSEVCSDVAALMELPRALRTRVLRRMHAELVGPDTELSFDHVGQLDQYITTWHGQGPTRLPGGVRAEVAYERLCLRREPNPESTARE
jgi:tRNA(Ile)-lysidine synthase